HVVYDGLHNPIGLRPSARASDEYSMNCHLDCPLDVVGEGYGTTYGPRLGYWLRSGTEQRTEFHGSSWVCRGHEGQSSELPIFVANVCLNELVRGANT